MFGASPASGAAIIGGMLSQVLSAPTAAAWWRRLRLPSIGASAGADDLTALSIGERCQIGAGSVVTKNIPSYSVAVGNPARVIKRYDAARAKWIRVDE